MAPLGSWSRSVIVTSAKTLSRLSGSPDSRSSSCWRETIFCCRVRISSSPVRSPTWARRGYSWPPKLRWLIRPSGVRSKRAPYVSSSHTRSGASLACSSAIRHELRNLPPRIVSRKCTCQLSLLLTLPMLAAMPPSAMTVCALPNSDLQITATRIPASRAAIAARRPAPPAPMTRTSYAYCSTSFDVVGSAMSVHQPQIGNNAGRHQRDVGVRDHEGPERRPGELHVTGVELRHLGPQPVARRVLGEVPQPPADEVAAGVTGSGVGPEEDDVDQHDQRAEPDAEPAVLTVERPDDVVGVDERHDDRGVEEVAVRVLEDQREPGLAGVLAVRLGDGVGRRRQPERAVVGLAVVVAGQPETEEERQDQQAERDERRELAEPGPEVARGGDAGRREAGRRERREVVVLLDEVVALRRRADERIQQPGHQQGEGDRRLDPPPVGAQRARRDARPPGSPDPGW